MRLRSLLAVQHGDEDMQRRGRNVIILALGMIAITLAMAGLAAFEGNVGIAIIPSAVSFVVHGIVIFLTHRGWINMAAMLMAGVPVIAFAVLSWNNPGVVVFPFFSIIPILLAMATLGPSRLAIICIAVLLSLVILHSTPVPSAIRTAWTASLRFAVVLVLFVGFVGIITNHSIQHSLRQIRQSRAEARRLAHDLEATNKQLDAQVQERTASLREALMKIEAFANQQTRLLEEVTRQKELIARLSLPVLPVAYQTLVIPLIGATDAQRLHDLHAVALQAVEQKRARHLILDLTGVATVEPTLAHYLVQLAQGVQLLGARLALVGVRPEVAQTLVNLDRRDDQFIIYRDLESALTAVAPPQNQNLR